MARYSFMSEDVQAYVEQGQKQIFGWLHPISCFILPIIDEAQKDHNIAGDICEIGIFEGKTLVLLGLMARAGEILVGLDIEIRDELRSNLQSDFPQRDQFVILQQDSTKTTPSELLQHSPTNGFRLFHVDGYHTFNHALNDLKLAVNTLSLGGVIFLDDFYSGTLPGVTQAFHHLFEQNLNNGIFPFALGGAKVYMCHEEYVDFYRNQMFEKMPVPSKNGAEVDELFGKQIAIYDLW
jgi:hypothetical protein